MSGVCALVTKAELEYWGIDELLLEPCCALKYYPEIELCCKGKSFIIINSEKCFVLHKKSDMILSKDEPCNNLS